MGKFIDLTGQRFGRLTVLRQNGKNKHLKIVWLCKCDCGNEVSVSAAILRKGHSKSCGCLKIDIATDRIVKLNTKHGMYGTVAYRKAHNILERCNNPKSISYKNYGGRGIKCLIGDTVDEVIESMKLIDGYFDGAELDRVNNDGHYELGNLRWVTPSENRHNIRDLKSNNTSGVKGVSFNKSKCKWNSKITINKVVYQMNFPTFEDAVWHRQSLEEYYYLKQFIKNGYEVGVQK